MPIASVSRARPPGGAPDRPDTSAAGITFIGGVPTKRAAKIVAGLSYSAAGAASCSMRPVRISTTWSAMVIASTWSCVTYSMVMPRRLLQRADLAPHLDAQLRIEIGERLVHQADLRLGHDRAAERDALLLAAGELRGLAVEQRLEPEDAGGALEPRIALGARHVAHLQAEQDVLGDREMRKQRVALEHHRDAALGGRQRGDVAVRDGDRAGARGLEPGDQPQASSTCRSPKARAAPPDGRRAPKN